MIRFKNTDCIVLILGLLLSHTPLSHSQAPSTHQSTPDVIPATYDGTFIYPKWTWNRVLPTKDGKFRTLDALADKFLLPIPSALPTKDGDLRMVLNFTFKPMIVNVKLPGEIRFYQQKTLKVNGTTGHFSVQGGVTLTGNVIMNFNLPSLSKFLVGRNDDIHISRKIPVSYVTYPFGGTEGKWNKTVVLDNYLLRGPRTGNSSLYGSGVLPSGGGVLSFTHSSGRPMLYLKTDTPGHIGIGAWSTDIAANIANALEVPYPNSPDKSARILSNHLKNYLDADMYFTFYIWSEYTFACKAFTINGTSVTEENQVIPAPDFDPTKRKYKIESNYDAEFTYALNLDVSNSYASAKFTVLKDIELWSYEAKVTEKHVSLLPKQSYDIDFEKVSATVPIYPPPRYSSVAGIIPDPGLASAIHSALNIEDGKPITRAHLRQLTHLNASDRSISSLNGLEHAVNLKSLGLYGNRLSEVSLSKLKKLESLDLTANPLSKVSLSNLPELTELRLVNNTLSELSLANLKNLKYLVVESSTISKLSLSNLPNLREVNQHRKPGAWGPAPFVWPSDMNLSHLGISELSLSKLPHLKELDLSDNHLSDLSFLKDVRNLTHLNLSNNGISKITFPELFTLNNPKLILLNLSNNLLTTESARLVSGFFDLKYLDFSHNRISDVLYVAGDGALDGIPTYTALYTALASNLKLTHLNLDNNLLLGVLRLHPEDFQRLTDLHLNNNHFSEVSLSGGPRNLKLIRLKNNPVSKVSLSGLTNMTYFGSIIDPGNHLSEVSLSDLTNMRSLTLAECPLLSKVSVSELPNLEEMYILRNPLLSEVSLAGIPNLNYLRFAWNDSLSTLSLPELPNLTTLICFDSPLSDVSFLKEVPNLTKLDFRDSTITDVSGLSNLTNLTELYLQNNLISDVSGLSNLTNLTKLYLQNNLISDVSGLSNLTNLTELYLQNNLISDATPLSNVKNLSVWDFSNNPFHPDSLRAYKEAGGPIFFPPSDLPVLVKISGDGQIGAPGETLPEPLVVQALDENKRPVSGASIRFFIYEGEGDISIKRGTKLPDGTLQKSAGVIHISSVVATTNFDGKIEAILTLGPNLGTIRIAAIGYDGFKASFTATATPDAVTPPQIAEDVKGDEVVNVQDAEDVNGDGVVNIQDLVLVSSSLGQKGESKADVNGDGVVNIQDLVKVSGALQ